MPVLLVAREDSGGIGAELVRSRSSRTTKQRRWLLVVLDLGPIAPPFFSISSRHGGLGLLGSPPELPGISRCQRFYSGISSFFLLRKGLGFVEKGGFG
uniref:Uncharacterized protein n=1 Tax=Fagus sylvatica TaxID=28930 RepID=A0A2N9G7W3_FAGSY